MKYKFIYILAVGMAAAMSGCGDDFTYPPMIMPEATMAPNTTIAEMKQLYWSSDRNYCSTITPLTDGTDMVIKGRVVSSDATGNVFKNIIIEDETAAITVAINAYDLYKSYQYGQEIVVNVTGMQIGGYNGLMQLGTESTYNGSPSMTFMTSDLFSSHSEPSGLADPQLVVPKVYTIPELITAKADAKTLCVTQSLLVKVEGVKFVDAGKAFAPDKTTDRYVVDAEGNKLNVRCSSYSTFKDEIIPGGTGSVTGILSYYGSDWQMILNDLDGLEGFTPGATGGDTPAGDAKGEGTVESPYNVVKALEIAKANGETSDESVYTEGYVISGSIDTEHGNGTWTICDNADGTGVKITVFRAKDFGNENFTDPDKVKAGDMIVVYAPIINFKGNTPETNLGYLYSINGVTGGGSTPETPDTPVVGEPKGEGTVDSPYNVAKALEIAKANGETSKESVYTEGYVISGSIDTNYGNGTWTICDNADGTGATISVFRAKDFGNENFTDPDKVKAGDKIVVYAPIINYKGNTPETSYGYLYSINGANK